MLFLCAVSRMQGGLRTGEMLYGKAIGLARSLSIRHLGARPLQKNQNSFVSSRLYKQGEGRGGAKSWEIKDFVFLARPPPEYLSKTVLTMELTDQEIFRRKAKEELEAMGINPYPAPTFEVNVTAEEIARKFPQDNSLFQNVSIAGRIMSRRVMGAASFAELQDATGRIQLYIKRDEICPGEDKSLYNTVFKKLTDIGDIVGVSGFVFVTQMGEISIHVKSFTMLSKSLRPLPVVKEKDGQTFDAFTDPEQRYRQRYVDLIVNPQVRKVFVQRTKLVNTMRDFLAEKGYLEVETPILQPLYGGASARPFKTHHNALDTTLYLRIANELYLKRLIVGG